MSELRIAPLKIQSVEEARRLLERACEFDKAHQVALEKLTAAGAAGCSALPFGAWVDEELVGVAAASCHWIRILAVGPDHRDRGIGTALLQACLQSIADSNAEADVEGARAETLVRIMDQPGNYLSPGIDNRNRETIGWLERRGFAKAGQACNLIIALHDNDRVSEQRLADWQKRASVAGYSIRTWQADEDGAEARMRATLAMVEAEFSPGWAHEVASAASRPGGIHLAVQDDSQKVVAFSVHDGNNQGLGWFGPTGTLAEHRGHGLGAALLLAALLDIRSQGHREAEVAWIGPRDFYDKIAGIENERHFTAMTRTLSKIK
jgi:GNAT superfamily N-acetyltransferase